jgi:hypothetical protein
MSLITKYKTSSSNLKFEQEHEGMGLWGKDHFFFFVFVTNYKCGEEKVKITCFFNATTNIIMRTITKSQINSTMEKQF